MARLKLKGNKWLTAPAVFLLLMGCSANETANQDGKGKEKDAIHIMAPLLSPESPGENSPSLKALETYTKKQIKVTWVPNSSYNDKFNIVMASGDLPQAIVVTDKSPGFIKSVKSGAFWELSPYLKDYPNLGKADKSDEEQFHQRRDLRHLQGEGPDPRFDHHQNGLARKCRSGDAENNR